MFRIRFLSNVCTVHNTYSKLFLYRLQKDANFEFSSENSQSRPFQRARLGANTDALCQTKTFKDLATSARKPPTWTTAPNNNTVHTGTTTRRHQFFCWSFPLHHHPSSRKTAAAFLPNNKQHQQVDSIQFSSLFEFPSRNSFLSPSILPSFFKHINSKWSLCWHLQWLVLWSPPVQPLLHPHLLSG